MDNQRELDSVKYLCYSKDRKKKENAVKNDTGGITMMKTDITEQV